jgi:hypothetical protein
VTTRLWLCALGLLALPACTRHKVELEVKPIHITMDINIKVQREIDDIFDDIEGKQKAPEVEKKAPEAEKPAPKGS